MVNKSKYYRSPRDVIPSKFYVEVGDVVLVYGKKCQVTEVVTGPNTQPLTRALITACPIDDLTGKPLTRTRIHPGEFWRHLWEK
jgi:hypothetical protein